MNPLSINPSYTSSTSRVTSAPQRAGDDSSRSSTGAQALRESDTVEFSSQARTVSGSVSGSDAPIRQDLVQRVRSEISAGTYDTPDKYLTALSKALGQINTPG